MGLYRFQMIIISIRKGFVDMVTVSDVTCMRQKFITRVVLQFYDTILSTE